MVAADNHAGSSSQAVQGAGRRLHDGDGGGGGGGRMRGSQTHAARIPFGLLAQLEKRVLDLNVGQRVDFGERREADVHEAMLASNVGEAVDRPCRLVVAEERMRRVGHGLAAICSGARLQC